MSSRVARLPERSLAPLPEEIASDLSRALADRGLSGTAQPLAAPGLVADATRKFVVFDAAGRPLAFVSLAPAEFPDVVATQVARARSARSALGERLGAAIPLPWLDGWFAGRSWSVMAYERPLRGDPVMRRWHAWRLVPAVSAWIVAATLRTAVPASVDCTRRLAEGLDALADAAGRSSLASAAQAAAEALRGADWKPRTALAHNDLWAGNLLAPRQGEEDDASARFRIIDWGASRLDGMPIYDLTRLGMSFDVGRRRFGALLEQHAAALDCSPAQTRHYLVSALGQLLLDRGQWPLRKLVETASACDRYWSAAAP